MTAQNPGPPGRGSDLRITLTAGTAKSTVTNPSCRPQDANLRCWGSLVLRIPEFGGLSVTGFEVHRVAVGNTSCGDEESGGCGDHESATARGADEPESVEAQVNGVAVLTDPGDSGLPAGTQVQVKITLTDNGTAQYQDTVDVQVNEFVAGSTKPLIYDTGTQTVQQVQIHSLGNSKS